MNPLTGPVPLFWGAVSHFWDAVPQIVELFHKKWNFSIKSGTVPLCVGLLGYCRILNKTSDLRISVFSSPSCDTQTSFSKRKVIRSEGLSLSFIGTGVTPRSQNANTICSMSNVTLN